MIHFRLSLLALATVLLTACTAMTLAGIDVKELQKPDVTLQSLSFEQIELPSLRGRFNIELALFNPNKVTIPVSSIDFRLENNGKLLLSSHSSTPFELPAQGESKARFAISLEPQAVKDTIAALRGKTALDARVSGHILISGLLFELPFEKHFDHLPTTRLAPMIP